jgi:hypothetical protein
MSSSSSCDSPQHNGKHDDLKALNTSNAAESPQSSIVYHGRDEDDEHSELDKSADRSIENITEMYFSDEKTIEYLTLCESNFLKCKEIREYEKEKLNLMKNKPKVVEEEMITPKQLEDRLQSIADSNLDYLDENVWKALSTRILIAFYLQHDNNVVDKVLNS